MVWEIETQMPLTEWHEWVALAAIDAEQAKKQGR